MTATAKPLVLWGGVMGPNPSKVAMILNTLSIPFEAVYVRYADIKGPEYMKINPNGRLPTLEDPNTGIRVWESGAIIDYLIEKYDSEFKLSYRPGTQEYYSCKQWLHYQMSGQGPYFGQALWFMNLHPEKIQSCIDRYVNEIKRVSAVLDEHLSTHKWLVGDKLTYADLSFLPWQELAFKQITPQFFNALTEFPHVQRWIDEMIALPGIKKVLEEKEVRTKEMLKEKSNNPT